MFYFLWRELQTHVSFWYSGKGKKVSGKKKLHDTENPSNNTKQNNSSTSNGGARHRFVSDKYPIGFLPPNYETFHQFVKSAYVHTLGLSGVGMLI